MSKVKAPTPRVSPLSSTSWFAPSTNTPDFSNAKDALPPNGFPPNVLVELSGIASPEISSLKLSPFRFNAPSNDAPVPRVKPVPVRFVVPVPDNVPENKDVLSTFARLNVAPEATLTCRLPVNRFPADSIPP